MSLRIFTVSVLTVLAVTSGCSFSEIHSEANRSGSWPDAVEIAVEETAAWSGGPAAPGAGGGDFAFNVPSGRQMSFTAWLTVASDAPDAAMREARRLTEEAGGYLRSLDNLDAVLMLPAAQAQAVLDAVANAGTVVRQSMIADDVTDQLTDLGLRIENLEALRRRLTGLLDRADKVEDMLKIEKELSRIVLELERFQAARKNLGDRVAYVTVYLSFTLRIPAEHAERVIPVPWVRQLGVDIGRQAAATAGRVKRPFTFRIPDGFVLIPTGGGRASATAVDADGFTIRLTERDNLEGGTLEFWDRLIRRSLSEFNHFRDVRSDVSPEVRYPHAVISGRRDIDGRECRYRLLLVVKGGTVYTCEAWGPGELPAAVAEADATFRPNWF